MTLQSPLLAVARTEVRLLLRRSSFWLYIALLCGFGIYGVGIFRPAGTINWAESVERVVVYLALFQLPLLAWLALPSVLRNTAHTRDWLWTTKLEGPTLVMGQALGIALGALFGLVLAVGAASIVLLVKGVLTGGTIATFVGYALALLLPLTVLELGVLLACGILVRRSVLMLGATTLVVVLTWLGFVVPYDGLTTPFNFILSGLYVDSIAGLGAERALLVPLLGGYVTLAIAALATVLLAQPRLDRRSGWRPGHGWRITVPLGLSVAGMIGSFGAYAQAATYSTVPAPVVDQVDTWSVAAATHTGSVTNDKLEVTARLTLTNTSPQTHSSIVVGLNPGLQPHTALLNGQPGQVQQQGEAVRLQQAGLAVPPGATVEVELRYAGTPRLLREDYTRASALREQPPAMFMQPIITYLTPDIALLQRDGDWRAWPLVAGPHHAPHADIMLTVNHANTVASSGEAQPPAPQPTYTWQHPVPQLLVAAAPYRTVQQPSGTVLLPALSDTQDAVRAATALDVWQRLHAWFPAPQQTASPQVALLPYQREVAVAGNVVGLPAFRNVLLVDRDHEPVDTERLLATQISRAWLGERLALPTTPLTTTGIAISTETSCTFDQGKETCVERNMGGVNPQAPHGRLGSTAARSTMLDALGIVMGQRLMAQTPAGTARLAEEHEYWATLATTPFDQFTDQNITSQQALIDRGVLSDRATPQTNQQLAQLVKDIHDLYANGDDTAFSSFIQTIITQHPLGGPPLTEEALRQQIAQARAQHSAQQSVQQPTR